MGSLAATWRSGRSLAAAACVATMLTTTVGTGTALGATTQSVGTQAQTLPAGWRAQMLAQVNALRANAGVAPLRACGSLRRAAQDYAGVMAQTNVFGHVGPDGAAPWDRMRAKGFAWQAAAENIASGDRSIADVMRTWVESPLHYANLMDPDMDEVGFGFAVDSATGTRTYWVQDFGRGTGC